jgi:hypothetical protein
MLHRILALCILTGCAAVGLGCGVQVVGPNSSNDDEALTPDGRPSRGKPPPPPSGATPPSSRSDVPPSPAPGDDVPGPTPPASEVATIISPFHPSGALTYQRPIVWTIGAFDAATVIHYTIDGTIPTTQSGLFSTGKVTLDALPEGTRIRWIAGGSSLVHEFTVHVDGNLAAETHHFVDNVRFTASGGPIVRAKPGATVAGKAGAAVWNGQNSCPTCIDQITIGITNASACLVHVQPDTFPGAEGTDWTFSIKAPTTPGVYKLKTGFEQQFKCADALGRGLRETEIGTIIVEP